MAGIKALAKETAVYGLSSIVGRFLNWCLVPLYVYIFPSEEYGIVSYLYSFTAVMLVILNYGMETGFFRFASTHEKPDRVYTTSLLSVGATSLLFIIVVTAFLSEISNAIRLPHYPEFVAMLAITVAMDAFSNIPFAYLRFKKRAVRFACIKLLNVGFNIGLNIFFLIACPALARSCPALTDWFYAPLGGENFGIGWIFVANLISSALVMLLLMPEMLRVRWQFERALWLKMLSYSWPLLILGVAGIMSQNMGQIIIPYLFSNQEAARSMVGIYGANIKIAIIMVMFTQAFRYAFEPFIFSQANARGEERTAAYCDAMKFFVLFGLWIFLVVMFFMPTIQHFVSPSYRQGLQVVPVMMAAELCFGVFFNLSLWYKLTDRTRWGMYMSLICFAMMYALNRLLVPMIGIPDGYIGSAWAALISYFLIMLLSYFVGKHYYPLPYQIGRMALYLLFSSVLFVVGYYIIDFPGALWLTYLLRSSLLLLYLVAVVKTEKIRLPGKFAKIIKR